MLLPLVLHLLAGKSPQQSPLDVAKERAALTAGVSGIVAPGALPGPMVASGARSFVVLTGNANGHRMPLFVAAHVEAGRVLAGGHESFLSGGNLRQPGNARFFANGLAWLGQRPVRGMKVGTLDLGVADAVTEMGGVPFAVKRESLNDSLASLDVICMTQGALDGDAAGQAAVMRFVKTGHGLLIAGPAWGWQSLHGDRTLREDHAGNRMLLPYGLGFSDGTLDGDFSPTGADDPLLQTDSALDALKKKGLSPGDTARATDTVQHALSLAPVDGGLGATIAKMAAEEGGMGGPTAQKPITTATPFSRLLVTVQDREMERQAPENVRAHPSAAYFPGAIPPNARRVARSVTVDTAVPAWHGTGLYAAPGEVVNISIPASAATAGLVIRVGTHTDQIWILDRWERFPRITRSWPLRQTTTRVASPFGGLIYIDVPENCRLGSIAVTVDHAVLAPRFVRGKMTREQWQIAIAEPGAPWAEFEGKSVILTVPRSAAATVKDPEALMAYWDEVMARCYELYAAPRRPRPERYCVDHQISAGYMHSGYPIMTFEDVANNFCDVEKLRSKGGPVWGFYHEMGHNFQEGDWTFEGTGEVTNNLFSLYGNEKLNAVAPPEYGLAHPAMNPAAATERLKKYLANGAKYSDWTNDPFLALTMYAQLRQEFGWEAFTKVFAQYRTLPDSQRPHSDLEKRDQWMVRFSRTVGRNLGPFFQAWGVPTSESARQSIANLPTWMPKDWPAL